MGSRVLFSSKVRTSMPRFLLGPFLALLPKRWRQSLLPRSPADWRVPTILSGFGEFLLAVAALLYWYSYSVTTWVSRGRRQRAARGGGLCGKPSRNSSAFCAG